MASASTADFRLATEALLYPSVDVLIRINGVSELVVHGFGIVMDLVHEHGVGSCHHVKIPGPPGVGKSYIAHRLANALIGAKDDSRLPAGQLSI